MNGIVERMLDILYPPHCPFCDEIVPARGKEKGTAEKMFPGGVCQSCRKKLRFVTDPYCMKCGKPLQDPAQEYCTDCAKRTHFFEQGRSLLVYDDSVRYSIYRFKYGGRKEYAAVYAQLTLPVMQSFVRMISPDMLIPVPLHRKREARRGYNQAQLYARRLGKLLSIPCRDDLAIRVKNTKPQKELDAAGRQNNLKKAFKITGNDVKLKTILLIDDIYTTGSTMDALSQELLAAGAAKVYFITIACGT